MNARLLARVLLGITAFPMVYAGVIVRNRLTRLIQKWYRTAETAETNSL